MKLCLLGLVVSVGLFGIGCGEEPAEEGAPPEPEVTRVASSLERKLTAPIEIPADTAVGQSIDALIDARVEAEALVRQPFVSIGATGTRCTIVRFDDDKGVEQMRRESCGKGADTLRVGKLLYTDQNADGKIDQFTDSTAATFELFDDDHDGKVDRMVESADRIATPISLTDFAENVTIIGNGKIATRARVDKDHDGKFEMESVTATTSFRIRELSRPNGEPAR